MALSVPTQSKPSAAEYIRSMQGGATQSKPSAAQYIRDMKSGPKTASSGDRGNQSDGWYIITLTGGRKYTLSQSEVDWIRDRQKLIAADYYDADDEDQARKAAGELPRAFLGSYGKSKLDSGLYDLGLPSSKYLDSYVAMYDEWYGDGKAVDFGSADAEKAIKTAYQKSWEYDYTPEDQQRKVQGLMPAALEASYADSYYDSDLFKRGLPSSKSLGKYVDQYNTNIAQTNRVNEFYADVASQVLQAQIQHGEKGPVIDDQGNSYTMSKYQEKVFFDTLGRYSDLGEIYVKRPKEKDLKIDDFNTTVDYYEAMLTTEERPNPEVFVSYDDFATKLPNLLKRGYAEEVVESAATKALGINNVGDAVQAQNEKNEFQKTAAIRSRDDVLAYIQAHPDSSAVEILTAMADAGVNRRQLKQARNYFVDQISDKAFESGQDVMDFDAQIAEVDGLFDDIVSGRKAKKKEAFDRNKFLDDWLTGIIQDDGRTFLSVDDAEKINKATLEFVLPGIASNESFHAALDSMRKNGASAETILTMALNTMGDALATNPVFGLLINQVRGASEALERAGVVENVPIIKPLNELEAIDAIRETVNGARADRLRANIEVAREKAVELGISQYEFDQTLRRNGLDSILNPTDEARNYFIDVEFPRSLGADEKQFADLPFEQRQDMAQAAWDSLGDAIKAEYVAEFDRNRGVNTDLHKSLGVQLENQILGKMFAGISADIVSGAINLADMAVGWIGGDKGQWEVSKAASEAAARVKSLGVAANQSAGSDVLNTATTIGAEVMKMYALNAAGVSLAKAVLPAQAGATAFATTGLKKLVDMSTWVRMVPFVATSMGSYYNEAMQAGATRGQATLYGVVCGTIEGALESLSADEWVGRGFGSEKIVMRAARGGRAALTAGEATKWKLITLGSSALGEAFEEGTSYFTSWAMQLATYNKDAQFSTDELAESMWMGAIIGMVGSGLSVSTANSSRIVYDFMAEHGFKPTLNDIAAVAVQVEAMRPDRVQQLSVNAEILSVNDYAAVQRDIAQHSRQLTDGKTLHERTLAKIDAELSAKRARVDSLTAQQSEIDIGDSKRSIKNVEKWGRLAGELVTARATLNTEIEQAQERIERENRSFKETQEQHRIAREKAQDKLDSHNVGMYNLFKEDLAPLRDSITSAVQKVIAESGIKASGEVIDAAYGSGMALDESTLDLIDKASDDSVALQDSLTAANADVQKLDAALATIDAKMKHARAGTLEQFNKSRAEAAAAAEALVAQEAEDRRLQEKSKPKLRPLSIEAENRIVKFGRRLGRKVVVTDLGENIGGYHEFGVLYINSFQPVNASGGFLNSPEAIVLKHELTHFIQISKGYNQFADFAMRELKAQVERQGIPFQNVIEALKSDYEAMGHGLDDDNGVRHELVARYAQKNLFQSEAAIRALVRENSGIAGQILNWLRYQIAKNNLRRSSDADAPERLTMLEAERLYAKAFRDAGKSPLDAVRKQYMLVGHTEDGRPIYRTNFPDGVTREEKQRHILDLVINAWSKNPITLHINRNDRQETIVAQFDPEYDPTGEKQTDATKLAFGNRHGTARDRKTTENLADDLYEIAETSIYDRSQEETGKDSPTHTGVREWHYFVKDIIFEDNAGNQTPYTVSIDVKEKEAGSYVYSIHAQQNPPSKSGAGVSDSPGTLHAPEDTVKSGTAATGGSPGTLHAPVNSIVPDTATATNTIIRGFAESNTDSEANYQNSELTWEDQLAPESDDGDREYLVSHTSWDDLLRKAGAHPQGMQPRARDIEVPKRTADGQHTSLFMRSALESQHVSDELLPELQQMIADGEIGAYTRQSNEATMTKAHNLIARAGSIEAAEGYFRTAVEADHKGSPELVAMGEQLLADAAARGDKEATVGLIADMAILATQSGRTTQAFAMLKKTGGMGYAIYTQKMIDRINAENPRIRDGKATPISLDAALMERLVNARTDAEVRAAQDAIFRFVGEHTPLTFAEAMRNWRYFSMLANPKTHFRNITGNFAMAGLRKAKDAVAAGIESMAVSTSFMQQSDRTHAVYSRKAHSDIVRYAESLWPTYEPDAMRGGKFGFESEMRKYARQSNIKWLDKLMKTNSNALEAEDGWLLKSGFIDSFTQYMVARDLTPETISAQQRSEAALHALNEARKATFRDASRLASWLNQGAQSHWAAQIAIEGPLPFKQTPINIAKRAIEYSPIGLANGIIELYQVKRGKVAASKAIDDFAAGFVGMALLGVGAWLARLGILRARGDDDDKLETFLEATGDQPYSLNIGGVSISIANVAPATIPLFIGARAYELAHDEDDTFTISDFLDVLSGIVDPLMDMSFLSSLNGALESYSSANAIGGGLGQVFSNAAQSYAGQYLPSVLANIGQFADPVVRTTKSSKASSAGHGLDYFARSLAKKIPGLNFTLEPLVDASGEQVGKDSFGEYLLDFANKFVLPGAVKLKDRDAVDREIIRVFQRTDNADIIPILPQKYVTLNGQQYNMTAKQYTEYSEEYGQAVYSAVKALMLKSFYQSADDEERADMLKKVIERAESTVRDKWKIALSDGGR